MRLAEDAYAEITAAMDRGWAERDARAYMLLQLERAGVDPLNVSPQRIAEILGEDK